MKKFSARWVSGLLTVDHKHDSVYNNKWNTNSYYMSETKQQTSGAYRLPGKRPGRITFHYWTNWGVLFRQDYMPAHTSRVAAAKLHNLCFKVLPRALYWPDLAPCGRFLFPNLKKCFARRWFTSNDEVKAETKAYFAQFDKSHYTEVLKSWEGII